MKKLWKKLLIMVGVIMLFAASTAYAAETSSGGVTAGGMKTSQLERFQYCLYEPANAVENMPLIVYLHGHGGPQNVAELRKEKFFMNLRAGGANGTPAYILAPLLPPELDFGAKGMWPGIEPSVMELIEYVADTYKIDRTRISIMGTSMGGDAAIQIAANHPEVFSCLVGVIPFHYKCPIAKWEQGWGQKLAAVPTWLLIEDEGSAKTTSQTAVDEILAAGGQAWLDVMSGADHGSANTRISSGMNSGQYAIFDWMISVSKPVSQ